MVIPAGQTKVETVEAPLREVLPGVHTVEVLLSAAMDQSPGNDVATVGITRLGPMIEVEMVDVSVSPEVLILGDDATVSLAVQNDSEIALPLAVNLYLDDAPQTPANQNLGEAAAGARSNRVIAWKLPVSGKHLGRRTLELALTSTEYGTLARAKTDVTLMIDAEIVGIDSLPAETAMRGEEVAIEVEVQNNGPAAVNVPITLHFPSETKDPVTRRPPVPAGSTETAHFTWKTREYAVGEHTLTANVPEAHNITGGDTSAELPFQLNPLTITAAIVDVAAYPEFPSVGEPVSITVTVRNDGPVATRIPITLHFPPGGRQPDSKKPHLDPGEMGTVVFEWLTGNYAPGTHRFRIEVAAVDNPVEYLNVKLLPTVENVSIIRIGTYPSETAMVGEPVEVWVDVRNDGPVATERPGSAHLPVRWQAPRNPVAAGGSGRNREGLVRMENLRL